MLHQGHRMIAVFCSARTLSGYAGQHRRWIKLYSLTLTKRERPASSFKIVRGEKRQLHLTRYSKWNNCHHGESCHPRSGIGNQGWLFLYHMRRVHRYNQQRTSNDLLSIGWQGGPRRFFSYFIIYLAPARRLFSVTLEKLIKITKHAPSYPQISSRVLL